MNCMFQECNVLEYLDLSDFDTSNVTNMSWMFNKCNKLKEIKGINKFITNKVTNMQQMFNECYELEYLDLSKFDTSNVTDMRWMFDQCNKLKYLNLSNFSIKGETKNMFKFKKDKCNFITNNTDLLNLYNLDKSLLLVIKLHLSFLNLNIFLVSPLIEKFNKFKYFNLLH